jgi:hypothetical protein
MKICSKVAHTLCAFVRDKCYWIKWERIKEKWGLKCTCIGKGDWVFVVFFAEYVIDLFDFVGNCWLIYHSENHFWYILPSTHWLKMKYHKRQRSLFFLSSSVRGWHGMKILVDSQFTTASATKCVMQWLLQAKINLWSFINYYPSFYSSRSIMSSYYIKNQPVVSICCSHWSALRTEPFEIGTVT